VFRSTGGVTLATVPHWVLAECTSICFRDDYDNEKCFSWSTQAHVGTIMRKPYSQPQRRMIGQLTELIYWDDLTIRNGMKWPINIEKHGETISHGHRWIDDSWKPAVNHGIYQSAMTSGFVSLNPSKLSGQFRGPQATSAARRNFKNSFPMVWCLQQYLELEQRCRRFWASPRWESVAWCEKNGEAGVRNQKCLRVRLFAWLD